MPRVLSIPSAEGESLLPLPPSVGDTECAPLAADCVPASIELIVLTIGCPLRSGSYPALRLDGTEIGTDNCVRGMALRSRARSRCRAGNSSLLPRTSLLHGGKG